MNGVVTCPECGQSEEKLDPGAVRLKHNANGSHSFEKIRTPRRIEDTKRRGKRRG